MNRSNSGSLRKTPTKTRETADKRGSRDDEDSDTLIQPRSRRFNRDVWDILGTDDEADLATEPSAGPTPSSTEGSDDGKESANKDSDIDIGENDFTPSDDEGTVGESVRVQPYPPACRIGPRGRRPKRRTARKTVLKEHNRGLQARQREESLPIFGLTEARASYGQYDRRPPFVFEFLGARDQISRQVVLTNELGDVEYGSPHTQMTTQPWDASDEYRFWVCHLGGECRHIMGRYGKGEGGERYYAWMGIERGFVGPVRAFPVFSGGRIGWGGVNLDTTQGPRESFAMDPSQASLPKSLVIKFKIESAKLQNLAITGDMEPTGEDDQLLRDRETADSTPDPSALSGQRLNLLAEFQGRNTLIYDEESSSPPESPTRLQEQQTRYAATIRTGTALMQTDPAPMQTDTGPMQTDMPSIQTETALVPIIETEVIDLVSDEEPPIKKEHSPQTPYPTPIPSTPSSTGAQTCTLSQHQLEHTILNMSIPPTPKELTIYLSDAPSLETSSFFAFIAKQWDIDAQSIAQLLVHLPWLGRQKIIKPHLDSTWFLLLKAIHGAPCWVDGDGCEVEVEIYIREGARVLVKGESDEGAGY